MKKKKRKSKEKEKKRKEKKGKEVTRLRSTWGSEHFKKRKEKKKKDVEDERDERDLAKAEEGQREQESGSKSRSVGTVMGSFPHTTSVIRICDIFAISCDK